MFVMYTLPPPPPHTLFFCEKLPFVFPTVKQTKVFIITFLLDFQPPPILSY